MLKTQPSKRGRKIKGYTASWGELIPGLSRRPADGRWRIVGSHVTYAEADERLAVARYRAMTQPKLAELPLQTVKTDALPQAMDDATRREILVTPNVTADNSGGFAVEYDITQFVPEAAIWAFVRTNILKRPEYVATATGIEQIAYLTDIKRPTPSATLKEIGDLYANKVGLSANEAGRSRLFWREFMKAVGVASVKEIGHDQVVAYESAVAAGNYAPKSILHRYRKVRTILAHSIKRGRAVEHCRKALDCTALLEIKAHTPLDPKPVSVSDFWKVYRAAEAAEDTMFAALLLTALNAAMYGGEVSALKWTELDLARGELVTRRSKTGVSRVAILWPETVKALKALPRIGDYVFNTRVRSYTTFSVLADWRKYRTAAHVGETITFGMIRDAAFTVACRSSSLDQARVLAGHRLPGASDHYVKRAPRFVSDACRAIRAEFFAKGKRNSDRREA